ncbi:MAG: DMT family transporter [Pseudomonadota bacterium]
MSAARVWPFAVLVVLGAGWGVTMPLAKIAVSTGHQFFGLILWQLAIGAAAMSILALPLRLRLPWHAGAMGVYVIIALIGSILPGIASYQAVAHLPAGVMSILLSMVPIWAFLVALALSLDRFEWLRLAGLFAGFVAVAMIVLPGAEMSGAIPLFWVLVALLSGFCYALEGNFVARWGTAGLSAFQVLWGASVVGTVLVLPFTLISGHWIDLRPHYVAPEIAQAASAVVHVLVYAGYVWLVRQTGPVFAVQVSFLVTLFGVFWAKLILSEAYAPTVWASLALMMLGMYLVQPRAVRVDAPAAMRDTAG